MPMEKKISSHSKRERSFGQIVRTLESPYIYAADPCIVAENPEPTTVIPDFVSHPASSSRPKKSEPKSEASKAEKPPKKQEVPDITKIRESYAKEQAAGR